MNLSGYVRVLDKVIYYDPETQQGLPAIINAMSPVMAQKARKFYLDGLDFDDKMSELKILTIMGVKAFDMTRDVKLSSFLQTYYTRKIHSKIKAANRAKKNASRMPREEVDGWKVSAKEISFCEFSSEDNDNPGSRFHDIIYKKESPVFRSIHERINFEISFRRLCSQLEPRLGKALTILYFENETLSYAAKKSGISVQLLINKIQPLSKNHRVRSLFGR